jgi:hypothetical protein
MAQKWRDMSFIGNFAAAAESFGKDHLGAAWGVAGIPFQNTKDREMFLAAVISLPHNEVVGEEGI